MLAELRGVRLRKGNFELFIDRLSLPEGVSVIIGPNGSGKSTLLRILVGRMKPQEGIIKRNYSVPGYAPQRDYLKRNIPMRVIDVMRLLTDDEEKIRKALERVKLQHKAFDLVNGLSGGERQRLLIARTLALDPDAYFRDEPFAGCDFESKLTILEIIREESKRKPFVIVTHDPNALVDITDTLVVMNKGRVAFVGSPHKLSRDVLCNVYGPACKVLRTNGKIFLRLRDQH